ncbi:response regulator transcription factor [Neobacillus bataviensis]|uniref:response regulator transcription factor n=1 Tax=Neobacillus bataviensis TaxID=220685 RepID=UPI001CBC4400|nr:response regulator transcription factor [Neobacillus bataviensis]
MRLLLLDDETVIGSFLQEMLQEASFEVDYYNNAKDTYNAALENEYDLMILDITLDPYAQHGLMRSGFDVARMVNEKKSVPYIYLTARADPADVTQGLYSGAEDYITKPYNIPVLIAKIQTVIRRLQNSSKPYISIMSYKDLTISLINRRVTAGKQLIHLSPTLFDVLVCLVKNKNHAVSREEIAKEVWGYDEISDSDKNKIDVAIKRLREMIPSDYIQTVRGVGYLLED